MPRVESTLLAAHIRRMTAPGTEALTDAELIGRYAAHRDAAAFEVLVWRHGPMVWATCRRILRHQHDVEDAFQATFLALARTAKSIRTRQVIGGWLHQVAMNAALKLKAERGPTEMTLEPPDRVGADDGELAGVVDEELARLPERMRVTFVLCGLEGMTSAEAARELGCPVGTIDSRLHAARARLRDRLTRRGFGPGALTGLVLVAAPPANSVAAVLGVGAGVLPSPAVDTLAREVSRIMKTGGTAMKVTITTLALVFAGTVWAFGGAGDGPAPEPKSAPPSTPVGPGPGGARVEPKSVPTDVPVGPGPGGALVAAPRPREPRGDFGDYLGKYLTIEGVVAQGGKVEAGTILVDTVNGKKLDKPVSVVVRASDAIRTSDYSIKSLDLPAKQRCVLKGYELGEMVGTPPAVYDAAKEQGRDVAPSQAVWRWRPYFVALIVVEPKGLEFNKK